MIKNTTPANANSNDPFWEKAETALLQALFFFIYYRLPTEEQNFGAVLRLLRMADVDEEDGDYSSDLDILFEKLAEEEPAHIAVLQYAIFKQAAGKTAKSILISAGVRLASFNIPAVANLTANDTLELEKIGNEKMALFVLIPDGDTTFNFIAAMLYSQMFALLYQLADATPKGRLERHVRFLLDEFANIGEIPEFDKYIATMRSRNISVSPVIQHIAQLKTIYKNSWETIIGCCDSKLYLGCDEPTTTKYFSEILGKETIDTRTWNLTKGRSHSAAKNFGIQGRELMQPNELAQMPDTDCILMVRGVPPFYSQKYNLKGHKNYKNLYEGAGTEDCFWDYKQIVTPKRIAAASPVSQKKEKNKPLTSIKDIEVNIASLNQLRYAIEYEF
ncbi:MAG: type IV secretory system conjugative DNA transfer family protein [Eubacteriales bacterium]|nr:type IV secretory system conjugative DNA transfer family protein [Eubacteriales bacterium]